MPDYDVIKFGKFNWLVKKEGDCIIPLVLATLEPYKNIHRIMYDGKRYPIVSVYKHIVYGEPLIKNARLTTTCGNINCLNPSHTSIKAPMKSNSNCDMEKIVSSLSKDFVKLIKEDKDTNIYNLKKKYRLPQNIILYIKKDTTRWRRSACFTKDEALKIYRDNRSNRALALVYNVSPTVINDVKNKKGAYKTMLCDVEEEW